MRRLILLSAFAVLTLYVTVAAAAQGTCSTVVDQALADLSNNCGDLPRNTACYGYNHVIAAFFDNAFVPSAFNQPNDRVDLASLESITTSPLNVDTSEWGIAVLKLQADLPDALPGQAVTFLLLGDVQLKTGVVPGSDQNPMQAIYFTTGIADTKCSEAPDSSLIIQGPQNITVNLQVNGAKVQFGSTLLFRSTENSSMECGVLDGSARVGGPDGQVIPAGFAARVPLDSDLHIDGDWGSNQTLADADAQALQVLRQVKEGVLNYSPDVPTPEEVNLMGALDTRLVSALDPHLLRQMVHLLVLEGADSTVVAALDVRGLRQFIVAHQLQLSAADRATFPDNFYSDLLKAIDDYLNPQGG